MVRTPLLRAGRVAGWLVLAVAVLPVLAILLKSLVAGPIPNPLNPLVPAPTAMSVLQVSDRQAGILLKTVAIAGGAVIGSFAIAIPATFAMVQARGVLSRAVLYAAIVWPLLAPPSVIAFAWNLLATQKTWLGKFMLDVLGWNTRAAAPFIAAWLQATWLWPVPTLALLVAFRLHGESAQRLALLDARPFKAFIRAAIPAMRGAIVAAAG